MKDYKIVYLFSIVNMTVVLLGVVTDVQRLFCIQMVQRFSGWLREWTE